MRLQQQWRHAQPQTSHGRGWALVSCRSIQIAAIWGHRGGSPSSWNQPQPLSLPIHFGRFSLSASDWYACKHKQVLHLVVSCTHVTPYDVARSWESVKGTACA